MGLTYTQAPITAGAVYSDSVKISGLPFDIGTQTDAVQAALLNKPPSGTSEAEVITEVVDLVFSSGDRTAGQSSVWSMVFPVAETLKLKQSGVNRLLYSSVYIQVLIAAAGNSRHAVFLSQKVEVSLNVIPLPSTGNGEGDLNFIPVLVGAGVI